MWRRSTPAILVLMLGAAAACSPDREAIVLQENVVTVENQTAQDWRSVVITVNDHFRGGAATLAAGGTLTAPLSQFQTGYGQRFAINRQPVFRIDVTATDAAGNPVTVAWSHNRK